MVNKKMFLFFCISFSWQVGFAIENNRTTFIHKQDRFDSFLKDIFIQHSQFRKYMTSSEMSYMMQELTGFDHVYFHRFRNVIGFVNDRSGVRSNDKNTLLINMILKIIFTDISQSVYSREIKIAHDQAKVFYDIELKEIPSQAILEQFTNRILSEWLYYDVSQDTLTKTYETFKSALDTSGLEKAYVQLLAQLLYHPALYYY